MPFRFGTPAALLLLLLLPVIFIIAHRSLAGLPTFRRRFALALRTALLLVIIFALADMQWVKFGKDLTVFFLVDQSRSIPPGSRNEAIAYINKAVAKARKNDRAGLILFGRDAGLEKFPQNIPSGTTWFRKSSLVINRERTDLAGAVRLALAAFPENSRKRIVMLTDGCENKGLVSGQADVARSMQCPIDVKMIDYEHTREVLIEKALIPPRLRAGEPFELRVVVKALQDCDAELALTIDGRPFETGRRVRLRKGKEVMSFGFPEGLAEPGPYAFEAAIRSPADTILENNTAVAYTWVEGKAHKVLLIDSDPDNLSYLVDALAAEDIDATAAAPASLPPNLTELRRYDCLVLSNVGAEHFVPEQLGMIEGAVKELGMGLVLIGGERSFGAGGYRETPIEDCSPVDFDIRQKRVMPKGAIVLAMDAAEDARGNRWAIEMAAAALNVLSYHDEMAIYAGRRWHVLLNEVQDKVAVRIAIDKLQVDDDNDYNGQLRACLVALRQSSAASKHVLIMTDGGHGRYNLPPPLMKSLKEARVSVTAVLFHPHSNTEKVVINSLTNLAIATGGRFYYPKTADELPMIFFKEATMITRSLIHEESFSPILQQSTDPVHGFDGFPNLGGYVLTTPKARAQVPIVRRYLDTKLNQEISDPILAHWNYGLGKVVAFTSDAKNRWAAEWVGWAGYRKFWPQVIRWALPSAAIGSATVRSSIDVRDDKVKLAVDFLDAAGLPMNFLELKGSALTPHADTSGRLESLALDLQQTGPGRYEAEFEVGDPGAYFVSLVYAGTDAQGNEVSGRHTTATSVPYSAEYRDLSTNTPLLRKIVENTGGRFLDDDTNVFERTMPASTASQPIWPLLLFIAVVVFPADVAFRKITLDWRRAAEAAAARIAALWPKQKEGEQIDTGMGRLLLRKQKAQESLSEGTPVILQARIDAEDAGEPFDAFAEQEQAGPGVAKKPEKAEQPPEPEVNTFTQRLVQAKKRAGKKKS